MVLYKIVRKITLIFFVTILFQNTRMDFYLNNWPTNNLWFFLQWYFQIFCKTNVYWHWTTIVLIISRLALTQVFFIFDLLPFCPNFIQVRLEENLSASWSEVKGPLSLLWLSNVCILHKKTLWKKQKNIELELKLTLLKLFIHKPERCKVRSKSYIKFYQLTENENPF